MARFRFIPRRECSLIVSDEPLSAETNYRTEFVAVLSNHPQGGFIALHFAPIATNFRRAAK